MALDTTQLTSFGTNNQLYAYVTADDLATATGAGYWDALWQQLKTNDVILVVSTAATGGGAGLYRVVVDAAAKTVTLSAL